MANKEKDREDVQSLENDILYVLYRAELTLRLAEQYIKGPIVGRERLKQEIADLKNENQMLISIREAMNNG